MNSSPSQLARLIDRSGTARARDLEAAGVSRAQLSRLVANGKLMRVARGLYGLPDRDVAEDEALVVVAKRAPNTFFCLLTALRFHGLTTQAPFEVWIGIGNKDRAPRLDWPSLRVVRYSGMGLEAGIETHQGSDASMRVSGVARTVVDCFKFRNKIGLDVALEALRQVHHERRVSVDELWRYGRMFRVAKVMRPYLEALA